MVKRYKIVFVHMAEKQFSKLDRPIQLRIASAIAKLVTEPFLGKLLKGEFKEYRSLRVGDWRVIYLIRHLQIQIEIIRVAHRREVYE